MKEVDVEAISRYCCSGLCGLAGLVCDEARQMAGPTPLIWRGSQAAPIPSCPATWCADVAPHNTPIIHRMGTPTPCHTDITNKH